MPSLFPDSFALAIRKSGQIIIIITAIVAFVVLLFVLQENLDALVSFVELNKTDSSNVATIPSKDDRTPQEPATSSKRKSCASRKSQKGNYFEECSQLMSPLKWSTDFVEDTGSGEKWYFSDFLYRGWLDSKTRNMNKTADLNKKNQKRRSNCFQTMDNPIDRALLKDKWLLFLGDSQGRALAGDFLKDIWDDKRVDWGYWTVRNRHASGSDWTVRNRHASVPSDAESVALSVPIPGGNLQCVRIPDTVGIPMTPEEMMVQTRNLIKRQQTNGTTSTPEPNKDHQSCSYLHKGLNLTVTIEWKPLEWRRSDILLFRSPEEADKVLISSVVQDRLDHLYGKSSSAFEQRRIITTQPPKAPSSASRLAKFRPKGRLALSSGPGPPASGPARNQNSLLPDAIIFSASVHPCFWMPSHTALHVSDFRKYFHFLMEQYRGPVIFVDIQEIGQHPRALSEDWLKCVRALNAEAFRLSKLFRRVAYVRRSELTKASRGFQSRDESDHRRETKGPLSNVENFDGGVHFQNGIMYGLQLQYVNKALRCVL